MLDTRIIIKKVKQALYSIFSKEGKTIMKLSYILIMGLLLFASCSSSEAVGSVSEPSAISVPQTGDAAGRTIIFPMPKHKVVIQFIYPELPPTQRNWWLIIEPGMEVDLCSIDPAHDVDLYVTADLKAMTKAWMGHSTFQQELDAEKIMLTGDRTLARSIDVWIGESSLACKFMREPAEAV